MKASAAIERDLTAERYAMVERQIVRRGVRDELVLEAVRNVPREAFLPEDMREFAYEDSPLPIGRRADDLAALHCRADERSAASERRRESA